MDGFKRVCDSFSDRSSPLLFLRFLSFPLLSLSLAGEQKQVNFMLDAKQGDTICLGADGQGCGTVVQDHKARR